MASWAYIYIYIYSFKWWMIAVQSFNMMNGLYTRRLTHTQLSQIDWLIDAHEPTRTTTTSPYCHCNPSPRVLSVDRKDNPRLQLSSPKCMGLSHVAQLYVVKNTPHFAATSGARSFRRTLNLFVTHTHTHSHHTTHSSARSLRERQGDEFVWFS